MAYLPRLYNPYPFIIQQLYFLGHRVKKIDNDGDGGSEWITILPRGWKELSDAYDNAKGLNIKHMEIVSHGKSSSKRSSSVQQVHSR